MKIIKSGKNKKPKELTTDCNCGCKFRFSQNEARSSATNERATPTS